MRVHLPVFSNLYLHFALWFKHYLEYDFKATYMYMADINDTYVNKSRSTYLYAYIYISKWIY